MTNVLDLSWQVRVSIISISEIVNVSIRTTRLNASLWIKLTGSPEALNVGVLTVLSSLDSMIIPSMYSSREEK